MKNAFLGSEGRVESGDGQFRKSWGGSNQGEGSGYWEGIEKSLFRVKFIILYKRYPKIYSKFYNFFI